MRSASKRFSGFTLIELLVVISVISLLSSVLLTVFQYARARSVDAAQQKTIHQISDAVQMYIEDKGEPPPNPLGYSSGGEVMVAYSNTNPMNDASRGCTECGGSINAFTIVMEELVGSGYLSEVPTIPNPDSGIGYFTYGPQTFQGAVIFGALPSRGSSTEGPSGTCRFPVNTGGSNQSNPSYQTRSIFSVPTVFAEWSPMERPYELEIPLRRMDNRVRRIDNDTYIPPTDGSGDVFPTCSSSVPNSSYCLCNQF